MSWVWGLYPSLVRNSVLDAAKDNGISTTSALALRSLKPPLRLTFQLETFVCPKLFQHPGPWASGDVSAL